MTYSGCRASRANHFDVTLSQAYSHMGWTVQSLRDVDQVK